MGESKVDSLGLSSMVLVGAYLAISAWAAYVASVLQYSVPLLGSLVANLSLFAMALLAKQGNALRLSWLWLGVNFVVAQSVLLPGTGYLIAVGSVAMILFAFDLFNFTELVYPMRIRGKDLDPAQYERTWSVLKRHVAWAAMYVAAAAVLALTGLAAYTPVVLAYNPVLMVGILVAATLVTAALLSSGIRTRRRTKEF